MVLVAAFGGFIAYKKGRQHALSGGGRKALPPNDQQLLERGITDIRTNDVVQYMNDDWLVEGVFIFEEDGHKWRIAHMMDGGKTFWLLVGVDKTPGVNVRLLEQARDLGFEGYPPDAINYEDLKYTLSRKGTASAKLSGDVGAIPGSPDLQTTSSLRCRWWLYEAAGQNCLLIEQWGETYRHLKGQKLSPDALDLLPAS